MKLKNNLILLLFDITAMNNTNEDVDDDADEDENAEPDDEN